ncbi:UDP-galactose translocator isoform X2 [Hyalella azteca]|uniref:UDP-galactose translocator isoform X2 n=1 Tax=Hyalella azteca TaxID=294128 RepID=A0A979FXY3_HYAAZ|nr:UDP-galactose translocator isoform X2 [Hyalella azteca]
MYPLHLIKMTSPNSSDKTMKLVSLVTLTVQNAAVALSMRYSRTRNGDMFIASTAVLMAEVVKLIASLYLSIRSEASLPAGIMSVYVHVWKNKVDTLKVSLPAFIYLIQNNLLYVSASNLDAATYQVTYQLKILTTAMFAVLMLGRSLHKLQWVALVLLCIGVALVQLAATTVAVVGSVEQNKLLGVGAAIGACFCSGFAGIYFEKILKGSDVSIWMRNVQLSLASMPLGLLTCLATDWTEIKNKGFFFGYDAYVWYLVVLNATGGLLVAMVVKYADNILKNFATSLAIVLSMLVSIMFLGFSINFQYIVGTVFVIGSIFLYSYQPPKKPTVATIPPDDTGFNSGLKHLKRN